MPRATKAASKKAAPKKAAAKQTAAKSVKKVAVKKAPPAAKAPAAKKVAKPAAAPAPAKPAPRKKHVLDKFELEQKELLQEERARHVVQAQELRAEADQLAAEREPGDVQFDEESGEGGTTNIDRERDLALSFQAQTEVEEIDHALAKLEAGRYGVCEHCGQAIPKARLRAIPQARLCIACKSGGLSRR
jgi:DnaK suppressor protein